jgi:hypothetical protein
MADLTKLFALDQAKEQDGIWVELGAGIRIKVARVDNPAYTKALNKALAPYRHALRAGTLDDDTFKAVMARVVANTILVGWEGLDYHGEPLPYSAKHAEMLLLDPQLKPFYERVLQIANDQEAYRLQQEEEAAKNSEAA